MGATIPLAKAARRVSVREVRKQDPVTVGLLSQARSHHHVMSEAKHALIAGEKKSHMPLFYNHNELDNGQFPL